jgi:septal ring factor EnvC (AmiA/AmiB activator)
MEQDDIKFYRQLVKDAATENERLQGICKAYEAQANRDALEIECLRRELAEAREANETTQRLWDECERERDQWESRAGQYMDERDRLRRELDKASSGSVENYNVWCEQMANLRRELAEAQRDAARYRWLKDNCYCAPPRDDPGPYIVHDTLTHDDWRGQLDAAIDAAMAEPKEVPK